MDVRANTDASLKAAFDSKLVMSSRETISLWESTRIVENFYDLQLADPVITDPENPNSSIRVNGKFRYNVSQSKNTISIECILGDNYLHSIQLLPCFEYTVDTYRYSFKHADNGRLISSEPGKIGTLAPSPVVFRIEVNAEVY